MRTIKFRAYDKKNNRKIEDFSFCYQINSCPDMSGGKKITYTGYINRCFVSGSSTTSNIVIEQYTEFNDTNGKEIYEGDNVIISAYYIGDKLHEERLGVVVFSQGEWVVVSDTESFGIGHDEYHSLWEVVNCIDFYDGIVVKESSV